jgi:hypothetical protein
MLPLLVVIIMGTTSLTTYALWNPQGPLGDGGVISSGELTLTRGEFNWVEVNNPTGDPTVRRLTATQEISMTMGGDNLATAFTVSMPLPHGASGTWHLETGGVVVVPIHGEIELGDTILIPDALGSSWSLTLVVNLTAPTTSVVWVDPLDPPEVGDIDLGQVSLTAEQVRCGDRFVATCDFEIGGR